MHLSLLLQWGSVYPLVPSSRSGNTLTLPGLLLRQEGFSKASNSWEARDPSAAEARTIRPHLLWQSTAHSGYTKMAAQRNVWMNIKNAKYLCFPSSIELFSRKVLCYSLKFWDGLVMLKCCSWFSVFLRVFAELWRTVACCSLFVYMLTRKGFEISIYLWENFMLEVKEVLSKLPSTVSMDLFGVISDIANNNSYS